MRIFAGPHEQVMLAAAGVCSTHRTGRGVVTAGGQRASLCAWSVLVPRGCELTRKSVVCGPPASKLAFVMSHVARSRYRFDGGTNSGASADHSADWAGRIPAARVDAGPTRARRWWSAAGPPRSVGAFAELLGAGPDLEPVHIGITRAGSDRVHSWVPGATFRRHGAEHPVKATVSLLRWVAISAELTGDFPRFANGTAPGMCR